MERKRSHIEGKHLHEYVHEQGSETRGDVRIVRGLRLRSMTFGLYGVADLVEFHPDESGAEIPGCRDKYIPYPVEYKLGRKRFDKADEVQLCAQAVCLEEMLGTPVPQGAIYYGQPRRRTEIVISGELRRLLQTLCARTRELLDARAVPFARTGRHCANCSLVEECMPEIASKDSSSRYVSGLMKSILHDTPEEEDIE